MNVFEDLIEELRDENLLEETVIDLRKPASSITVDTATHEPNATIVHAPAAEGSGIEELSRTPLSGDDERDFYRKRAMDEVSSLQMVEHVLSGIEREHMKACPATYDDLEAKKALHRFLQVQGDSTTSEYAEAEFQLMNETEAWSTALANRDRKVSVSNLRRFCENSRPALSSQALLALARFYRNASYSELVRSKFEFVMTRLFSREIEGEKRRLLFGRQEMVGHIKTLYANWSSVALYSAHDISVKTRAIVAGFEDRVAEVEAAETLDELLKKDFFKKVHEFKEATGEIFFSPEIVAATIECNTKVGNKFVDLVGVERGRNTPETIEQKYGYEYDQIISAAAGKTLHMLDVMRNLPDMGHLEENLAPDRQAKTQSAKIAPKEKQPLFSSDMFRVNKWLLAATILIVAASAALYFWSSQPTQDTGGIEQAQDVNFDNTDLKEYLRSGRASDETLYAITLPAWDQLPEDNQKEVLRQALAFAETRGQKTVQLLNFRGRNVAFASKTKIELINSTP